MKEQIIQWLRKRCLDDISDFYGEGEVHQTPDGVYIFRDTGASVLYVAHLDFVCPDNHFRMSGNIVKSPRLDDRLGAWVGLDILDDLHMDILLTEGEEKSRSTAKHFVPPRQYNWIVEFDRMGNDVVLYHYDTTEWRKILTDNGFKVGRGSVSDISYLGHLGCKAMNIGVGYKEYHGPRSNADLNVTAEQVALFRDFYDKYRDVHMEHKPICRTCNLPKALLPNGVCKECDDRSRTTNYYNGAHYRNNNGVYIPATGGGGNGGNGEPNTVVPPHNKTTGGFSNGQRQKGGDGAAGGAAGQQHNGPHNMGAPFSHPRSQTPLSDFVTRQIEEHGIRQQGGPLVIRGGELSQEPIGPEDEALVERGNRI